MKTRCEADGPGDQSILLVDDVPQGTVARKSVLMSLGYQVQTAESGYQALALLTQQPFDLMVTDLKMPGMDGLELIGHAKLRYPAMRIVLLSALADAMGYTAESTGADAVMPKSNTELNQLTRIISKLLVRKPARKPVASQKHAPLVMVKSS